MPETKPQCHVSVWIGSLAMIPYQAASAAGSTAEREGGRDVVVTESGDGTELAIGFGLDLHDNDARAVGQAVLDAVDAEDFVWTVTVVERF